jgi:hypothetical protein
MVNGVQLPAGALSSSPIFWLRLILAHPRLVVLGQEYVYMRNTPVVYGTPTRSIDINSIRIRIQLEWWTVAGSSLFLCFLANITHSLRLVIQGQEYVQQAPVVYGIPTESVDLRRIERWTGFDSPPVHIRMVPTNSFVS